MKMTIKGCALSLRSSPVPIKSIFFPDNLLKKLLQRHENKCEVSVISMTIDCDAKNRGLWIYSRNGLSVNKFKFWYKV